MTKTAMIDIHVHVQIDKKPWWHNIHMNFYHKLTFYLPTRFKYWFLFYFFLLDIRKKTCYFWYHTYDHVKSEWVIYCWYHAGAHGKSEWMSYCNDLNFFPEDIHASNNIADSGSRKYYYDLRMSYSIRSVDRK